MENIIWTNDTGQIDAIIEDWRQDALALAAAMAENPRGTVDETEYGTGLILEKAWEAVVDEYEIPTPRRLSDAIRSIDASDTRIRAEADDLNAEYRMDERMNFSGLGLDHPVIILGKAGLWDGTRTIASIVAFDNIGDIIADSPWNGMEYETWGIDEHDDLRYSGVHHDGVNTCTFRELKDAPRADRTIGQDDMRRLLRASRPLGPRIRKVYGMPTPAKKRGNR